MTHDEIQAREIAELYVRGRLSEADRIAFEDHYFGCDACFAEVRSLQQFVEAVKEAGPASPAKVVVMPLWRQPAFVGALAASVAMAVVSGWVLLLERPRLTKEVARAQQASERTASRLQLAERELAARRAAESRVASLSGSLPLLMLEATRAEGTAAVQVPQGATVLALWMEPPPAAASTRYRLEILRGSDVVETVENLERNSYGALAVSVTADKLSPGTYQARVYSQQGLPALVGEYRFDVRK